MTGKVRGGFVAAAWGELAGFDQSIVGTLRAAMQQPASVMFGHGELITVG